MRIKLTDSEEHAVPRSKGRYNINTSQMHPQAGHGRDQLYTNAVPTQDLGRFMFGFRLKAKSEHEAAQVLGWYGVGVELIPPVSCLRVHLAGVNIISTFAAWYSVFF